MPTSGRCCGSSLPATATAQPAGSARVANGAAPGTSVAGGCTGHRDCLPRLRAPWISPAAGDSAIWRVEGGRPNDSCIRSVNSPASDGGPARVYACQGQPAGRPSRRSNEGNTMHGCWRPGCIRASLGGPEAPDPCTVLTGVSPCGRRGTWAAPICASFTSCIPPLIGKRGLSSASCATGGAHKPLQSSLSLGSEAPERQPWCPGFSA